MTKIFLKIVVPAVLFLNSCKEAPKQKNAEVTTTEFAEKVEDDIVTTVSIDKEGKKLELNFNNTKGTLTLNFDGETIELLVQRAASGIWYKNDQYELRGKGDNVELIKDGKTVFKK
jgi:membrane-bound inhibitor of C-type lysozyme